MQEAEQLLDDLSPGPQRLVCGKQGQATSGLRGGFSKENVVAEVVQKLRSPGKREYQRQVGTDDRGAGIPG